MIWIFDIEVFINYFSVIFKNPQTKELKEFIIFKNINQLNDLYNFINDNNKWFIGYNNFNYDNQLLKFIHSKFFDLSLFETSEVNRSLYNLSHLIINENLSDYIYNLPFKYIDLMKLGGFTKSLKLMAVSLKWPKIQEIPVSITTYIEEKDLNLIREYNLNDVLITETLYFTLLDEIKFKASISKMYEVDCYSESNSGMTNRILEKFYSETTGLNKRDYKHLRTKRNFIKFDWVVFKNVNFVTPELTTVLEEIKNFTYYKAMPYFSKKIVFNNVKYKLGAGGIHSEDSGELFKETESTYIIDADVTSMYPNIVIKNNIYPEHLGSKFLKSYKTLIDRRIKAKKENNEIENKCLKIVIVSTVGKTLNEHLWLYDPLVNFKVTVNGQLYMLMLIEKLTLHNFKVISANTDGITTLVNKDREEEYKKLCEEWEVETGLSLEYKKYKKYARRDVNNYVAIYENGDTKEKGIFIFTPSLEKGYDKPVVSLALYNFFVKGIPVKETILNHKDIYDFCIAKKIDDKFTNEFHTIKNGEPKVEILQKSVRYYVSTNGGILLKTDRENNDIENYEVNRKVTIFNDYFHVEDMKDYNIDYGYYINSAQKIIDEIINPQLTLF